MHENKVRNQMNAKQEAETTMLFILHNCVNIRKPLKGLMSIFLLLCHLSYAFLLKACGKVG